MEWNKIRNYYLGLPIIFIISFSVVFLVYGDGLFKTGEKSMLPAKNNIEGRALESSRIQADTVIKQEIRYICGDKVISEIPASPEFVGLDYEGMKGKFPPEQGWMIDDTKPNTLNIIKKEKNICPYHRSFRHFGIAGGYLAVFEGPLGYNENLLEQEKIKVEKLPKDLQESLQQSMDYRNQPVEVKERIKKFLEFYNEEQLNEALESYDEYLEE